MVGAANRAGGDDWPADRALAPMVPTSSTAALTAADPITAGRQASLKAEVPGPGGASLRRREHLFASLALSPPRRIQPFQEGGVLRPKR